MFYVAGSDHIDFIALYLRNRKFVLLVVRCFAFDCGGGAGRSSTSENYNDGEWHSQKFSLAGLDGKLEVDGREVVQDVVTPFPGCMRNIRVEDEVLKKPKLTERVEPCSDKVEGGTYFPVSGSYIRLCEHGFNDFNICSFSFVCLM
ncbi:laminin subunit alpha-4-like [Tachypleus tridentatus]|uniref:laminin subunit alpha-4-like n=1 Tax=Tachypleus tridentatus TaxID=6853 RepID=UPI003FD1760B